jgi:hypothetical protein
MKTWSLKHLSNQNLILFYVGLVAGLGAVVCISPLNAAHNLGELGTFELAQVLVLAACVVLWLARGTFTLSLNVLIATIMLLFAGREISWARVYGAGPSVVDTIKLAHAVLLIVTLAALTVVWLRREGRKAKLFRAAFWTRSAAWLALGLCLMLFGDVFEKQIFDLKSNLFWEEWIELAGYVCFAIPALLSRR